MGIQEIDKSELVPYFAYGSNMNPERMKVRGVAFYSRELLILDGWSLRFHKITKNPEFGAANIIPDRNGVVEGILYTVSMEGISNLDKHEHYPTEYDRVNLRVMLNHQNEVEILTYIAHTHKTQDGLKPSRSYLDHLLAANDLLSEDYYNQLKKVETMD